MNDLALVILNYNSFDDTISCAKRLLSFGKDYHIIVVDNCSTDNSYVMLKEALGNEEFVDVLKTDYNSGYSAGNNFGIRYAAEKYRISFIAIVNPDVIIPDVTVIENLVKKLLKNDSLGIITGVALTHDKKFNISTSGWTLPNTIDLIIGHSILGNGNKTQNEYFNFLGDGLIQVDCVAGCFFIAKERVFSKIGYFDENVFLYNEENILGIKCRNKGYIEAIDLTQPYIHNHVQKKQNMSFKSKINATKNSYKSRKYLCKKYYSSKALPFLWIIEVINVFVLFLSYLKQRINYIGIRKGKNANQ